MNISRRRFLKISAVTAALLANDSTLFADTSNFQKHTHTYDEFKTKLKFYRGDLAQEGRYKNYNIWINDSIVTRENLNSIYNKSQGETVTSQYSTCMYAKDRLLYPMQRVGERGEGKWEQIDWESATMGIAQNIWNLMSDSQKGANSILLQAGKGLWGESKKASVIRFANLLGANLKQVSELNDKVDLSKLDKSDLVIFWGYNPMETDIKDAHYIQESRYKGVKFITLTPEYNQTARCSDLWIPIKKGSDDLVVMNLIYEIINNNIQKNIVTKYNKNDFSEYAPEKTEKITKINPLVIKQLAKQLAQSKNPKIICGNGYKSQENLNYLRNILDMDLKKIVKDNKFAFLSDFNGRYKAREDNGLPKEMVIATASSLFNKKSKEFKATFLQKTKFIVCIDTKASESAIYADIVLPATGIYESWDIYNFTSEKEKLLISKPPFELKNIGVSKDEWSIFSQIAEKLEFIANKAENILSNKIDDDTKYTTSGFHDLSIFYQEYINKNDVLNPMGTDELAYNIVRKKLNEDASNSTDKIYTPNNTVQGLENLPSTQEETSNYMYDFIFKKTKWNKNRNYSTSTLLLRLQRGEPIITINNVTAKKNGLTDAKKVMVSNENGEFISKLKTSSSVPFDAVIMNDGWKDFMFQDRLGYSEILSEKTNIGVNIKRVSL